MSRYGDSAIFEERERTTYAPSRRSARTREYDEFDVESRRSARPARSVPDFLYEDYDRDRERDRSSGALVVRDVHEEYDRPRRRPERERVEREEIIIKDEHRSPAPRARTIIEDDDVRSVRSARTARSERSVRPAPPRGESRTREEIDIKIRRDESEDVPRTRHRERGREVDDDEVVIRHTDAGRSRSRVDRDDISFRRVDRDRSRARFDEREKEEIIIRRNRSASSSRSPPRARHRDSSLTSERVIIKPRERSLPPREGMIAREREEIVVRRRKPDPPSPSSSPSPPPAPRNDVKEEIIIRRTEREPSPPTPPPVILPEPEPEPIMETRRPIIREEIHRDIITHYRNYDHGTEFVRRERTPSPPPPPLIEPEPVKEEKLEVAIRRKDEYGETEEDIIFEERKGGRRHRGSRSRAGSVTSRRETIIEDDTRSVATARSRRDRSLSRDRGGRALAHVGDEFDLAGEADYYNRRALERARPGEAYNGATREWELVDVPPGTSRVKMDGIGGGSQEITWQRYNGARRSRFVADGQDYVGYPEFDDRHGRHRDLEELPPPPPPAVPDPEPPVVEEKTKTLEISIRDRDVGGSGGALVKREKKPKEMWTEITKDLVIKEAIEEAGFGYEETEEYFYVMEYLRYEDVEALVRLSDHIRRQRKHRIKQIEAEREVLERVPSRHHRDREYDEEIILERRRRH